MIKRYLLLLLCFYNYCRAQDAPEFATPYNPENETTYSVRAVALPYFLGESYGAYNNIGVDFGFSKRHAVSLDLNYSLYSGSHEFEDETGDYIHDNPYCTNERSVMISYRYYLNWQKFRDNYGLSFYVSPFARIGQIDRYEDPHFTNEYNFQQEKQRSAGFLLGCVFSLRNSEHFGFDVNAGPFYKDKEIITQYQDSPEYVYSEKSNFGLRIGFSLIYWFSLGD